MKKIKKFLLSTFVIMLITSAIGFTSVAANEVEPNNGSNKATVIATDKVHSGKLNNDEDIDWYRFTNKKDYFQLTFDFDADYGDVERGWNIEIYTVNGVNLIKNYSGVKEKFTTPVLPFEGDYLIKVEADYKHEYYAPIDCTYKLKVTTVADKFWETENNDTSATANTIKVNSTYKGSIYKANDGDEYEFGDIDYFVFSTTTGAFNIKFSLDSSVSYDDVLRGWKITVYPYGSKNEIITYSDIVSDFASFDIPYKGKFLVKVECDYDHINFAPVDCVYKLKIAQHDAAKIWESEINDTKGKATNLTLGKYCLGNIDRGEDVDYFKYKAPANGYIKLTFKTAVSDKIGDGWKITVTDSKGKTLYEKDEITDTVLKKNGIKVKKGEIVYIKVESDYPSYDDYAPLYVNYKIGVSFKVKTDNVKGLTSKSTQTSVKLSWKAVAGVDGYKVYTYNSKTKKYKLIKTTEKTAYTIKDLKEGTKYTYYVKAYQKYTGEDALSSKYTKISTATKTKTPTLKVASTSKGNAVFNWSNVSGESGYQVYYSTKKDGEYKKVKNYSADTLKGTKSNLTSGKTYYFKVRAYTKTDSGTVYSSWSSVKSVKVK